jgi:hypothetical protein
MLLAIIHLHRLRLYPNQLLDGAFLNSCNPLEIRDICQKANLNDEIKFYREVAGVSKIIIKKKYEEVSSTHAVEHSVHSNF